MCVTGSSELWFMLGRHCFSKLHIFPVSVCHAVVFAESFHEKWCLNILKKTVEFGMVNSPNVKNTMHFFKSRERRFTVCEYLSGEWSLKRKYLSFSLTYSSWKRAASMSFSLHETISRHSCRGFSFAGQTPGVCHVTLILRGNICVLTVQMECWQIKQNALLWSEASAAAQQLKGRADSVTLAWPHCGPFCFSWGMLTLCCCLNAMWKQHFMVPS